MGGERRGCRSLSECQRRESAHNHRQFNGKKSSITHPRHSPFKKTLSRRLIDGGVSVETSPKAAVRLAELSPYARVIPSATRDLLFRRRGKFSELTTDPLVENMSLASRITRAEPPWGTYDKFGLWARP